MLVIGVLHNISSTARRFPSCWAQTKRQDKPQHIWTDWTGFIWAIPKTAASCLPRSLLFKLEETNSTQAEGALGISHRLPQDKHRQGNLQPNTDTQRTASNSDAKPKLASRHHACTHARARTRTHAHTVRQDRPGYLLLHYKLRRWPRQREMGHTGHTHTHTVEVEPEMGTWEVAEQWSAEPAIGMMWWFCSTTRPDAESRSLVMCS